MAELVEYSTIPDGDIARALLQYRLLNEFHAQVNNVDIRSKGAMLLKRVKNEFSALMLQDVCSLLLDDALCDAAVVVKREGQPD